MISVLHDPVFRVEYLDGGQRTVGLMEVLTNAHRIRNFAARTPTGEVALIRFCIVFALDVFRPKDTDDRRALMEAGAFDEKRITDYVSDCEKDGPRFLLDDEARPFMQAAYDPALDDKAERSVASLFLDIPSGNNHIHIDHQGQDGREADAATAFEALLETYLFCTAGLAGPSNVNNTPSDYALLRGGNLFETLALNMVSERELSNIPFGAGQVPWRTDEKVVPRESIVNMSLLRALTWRPRRVTLIFDEDGMVRRVYLQPGLDFRGNELWKDPHALYRRAKSGDMVTLKPELGRELWRDAGTLASVKGPNARTAVPICNVGNVWEERPAILDVAVTGVITNQAAYMGWACETLRLPGAILMSQAKAEQFQQCLEITERMNATLRRCVWSADERLAPQNPQKDALAQWAGSVFLQLMREEVFGEYLSALGGGAEFGDDEQRRTEALFEAMRRALDEALSMVVEKSGTGVQDLKRQNKVRGMVMGSYWKMRREAGLK